jgi:hypothetical protein
VANRTYRFEYQESRTIAAQDYGFYSLIMAAMRQADDENKAKLQAMFPDVWDELQIRYNAPGGLLVGETTVVKGQGYVMTPDGLKWAGAIKHKRSRSAKPKRSMCTSTSRTAPLGEPKTRDCFGSTLDFGPGANLDGHTPDGDARAEYGEEVQ